MDKNRIYDNSSYNSVLTIRFTYRLVLTDKYSEKYDTCKKTWSNNYDKITIY